MLQAKLKIRTAISMLLALPAISGQAAVVSLPPLIPAGQTVTVASTDRVVTSGLSGTSGSGLSVAGVLNNQGQIFTSNFAVTGIFENDGLLIANYNFNIGPDPSDGTNRKIINHLNGTILVNGYMDLYSPDAVVENAGNLLFGQPGQYSGQIFPFFLGLIHNTGKMSFNKPLTDSQGQLLDTCGASGNVGDGQIVNDGLFEIAQNTKCHLGDHPYTQNSGTTKIDGVFDSDAEIDLNGGVLTGGGTLAFPGLSPMVTIAPGSDLGILTIDGDGSFGGTIEMQLGGAAGNDKLVVNGNLNLDGARLYVSFREQYMLGFGQEVTLITADNITGYPVLASYPILPGNLGYELVQTATSIKMRISTKPR
ncbi:hypothetical protein [Methylomonas sp. UP202]|uniref:hypothetical protein n=1 Tax=Methylomonas sp. UP202 TaxID=3040943 RepID=UPI00247A260C|nr:hypothetical protein [Methylomonas sp. UP202]WGS84806.1 hypothetical protein QC632_17315 [Methylomonas sp. UP202]